MQEGRLPSLLVHPASIPIPPLWVTQHRLFSGQNQRSAVHGASGQHIADPLSSHRTSVLATFAASDELLCLANRPPGRVRNCEILSSVQGLRQFPQFEGRSVQLLTCFRPVVGQAFLGFVFFSFRPCLSDASEFLSQILLTCFDCSSSRGSLCTYCFSSLES